VTTVAFNALALRPEGTGVQTYILELLGALARSGTGAKLVATVQADAAAGLPDGIGARIRPCSDGLRRTLGSLRSVGPADLVHGLDVDLPAFPRGPAVSTVHDLSVFDVPWAFSRVRALGEQAVIRQALRRADAVLAPSSFTAERIAARFGLTATVVLEAPPEDLAPAGPDDVAGLRRRCDLPERFVLHVGSVEPRKDLRTLAEACRQAGVPLVLAGPVPRPTDVPGGAVTLGYVPGEDLPALYGAATVVGYPTLYEGFGLPPLEAMVCGAPVVASRVASLPEVLGDAARLVPPGDVKAWATALADLLADDAARAELAAAGRDRAAALTWAEVANGTRNVYHSLGVDL
jgi:glycosyltransferase involved in cell wall biosynthesis